MIFRQLMQFNPNRSWAITYSHMWNLSMRTPLPHKYSQSFNASGNSPLYSNAINKSGQNNYNSNGTTKRRKSDYCWSFNKGVSCKFGKKCKFIKRCRYCDSPAHGVYNCPKLESQKSKTNKITPDNESK